VRVAVASVRIRAKQSRDAEVEQQRPARRDEYVGRLDVAMDDQALVGEAHRLAHGHEQAQPCRHRLRTRVDVEQLAVDVFHDEVGMAAGGGATVEQPRDVRVRQTREDLPLAREIGQRLGAGNAAQHLDRGKLFEMPVAAPRAIHTAHAAVADALDQGPGAEHVAGFAVVVAQARQQRDDRTLHMPRRGLFALEQRAHRCGDAVIGRGQRGFARGFVEIADRVEQRFHARIVVSFHGPVPRAARRA
jgi:hypothetical protein